VPDPIFSHPRLAAVYDAFDDDRRDLDAYDALVTELGAHAVADIGCGTGCLALRLALRGLKVIGVDPAGASLDVARAKPGADAVTWLESEATVLPPASADLVVMTGNVAQVFLTDEEWDKTLGASHRALRPGGHLVFETRRPEMRAWEDWRRRTAVERRDVPGIGKVEQTFELRGVDLPLVSFRYTYTFGRESARLVSDSVLRFWTRQEIERSLVRAGFTLMDVRHAPDRPGLEHVFIAHT